MVCGGVGSGQREKLEEGCVEGQARAAGWRGLISHTTTTARRFARASRPCQALPGSYYYDGTWRVAGPRGYVRGLIVADVLEEIRSL